MISKSLLIALPMLALGACSSNSENDAESAEMNNDAVVEESQATDESVEMDTIEVVELSEEEMLVEQYTAAILETTISFEFDKSLILPQYAEILDAHAKLLMDNTDKSIVVEGHTDEKGTPEYNIALGERRGLAVSTYLENMGVSSSQIEVVSYGQEKPVNPAHDQAAWAENRRAELTY